MRPKPAGNTSETCAQRIYTSTENTHARGLPQIFKRICIAICPAPRIVIPRMRSRPRAARIYSSPRGRKYLLLRPPASRPRKAHMHCRVPFFAVSFFSFCSVHGSSRSVRFPVVLGFWRVPTCVGAFYCGHALFILFQAFRRSLELGVV